MIHNRKGNLGETITMNNFYIKYFIRDNIDRRRTDSTNENGKVKDERRI